MSGRQNPNESGERKGERERKDGGDLSKAGQQMPCRLCLFEGKKHQTHFHEQCLSSQRYSVYPSPQIRASLSKLKKCIFF